MKRAREQNESAAGQQGETAHHDTATASPDRKKPRAGRAEYDNDKEGGLEWNLVRDLPYVAFRRLLDFLSSAATADAGTPPFSISLLYCILFIDVLPFLVQRAR
jgi:hypothetical protein